MDIEPQHFKDVTIYTSGNIIFPNIVRIDAAQAKIWVGPHAQYKTAVFVEFLRKGKRKAESLVVSDQPYVIVVPMMSAIDPDDLYLPADNGVASTRYGIADRRWRTDFDYQLRAANVPILADYRHLAVDPETQTTPFVESVVVVPQIPVASDEIIPGIIMSESDDQQFEYVEGLRKEAERSFFQRNPRLVQQAKEIHGCICQACDFDFVKFYGALGQDFVEVHHLNPLAERSPEDQTAVVRTNVSDVAVLCANCHRMIHRRKPAFSVEQLRALVFTNGRS